MVIHPDRSTRTRAGRALAASVVASALTLGFAQAAHAGPAPVLLGTSSDYAVLGGSGLTNTGPSTILGDIGSSPTHTQTGFTPCPAANCVSLTGTDHDVADPNDAVTQQAKSDLGTAYSDAFGRTGGAAVSAPLGGGQTLVSGVYTSATNIFVGGDLTLDAQGDPNAVFIFQAKTGTLVTAAGISGGIPNTRVLLANGAQACNVYWQVGSSATIDTFTQFVGNVLADQSITVNTSATIDGGRVLARNGAVTLDTNTIRKATCATPTPGTDTGGTATTTTPAGTATAATPVATAPAPGGTTPTPTPTTPPAAKAAVKATAKIAGPSGIVRGPFTVSVTGRAISKVVYTIDGRRVATVNSKPGRKKFKTVIAPKKGDTEVHRVVARITFTPASGRKTTRLTIAYRGPQIDTPRPQFTG